MALPTVFARRAVRFLALAVAGFPLPARRARLLLALTVARTLLGGSAGEAEQTERAAEQRAQRAAAGASIGEAASESIEPGIVHLKGSLEREIA
jgi:hypothetical protein